MRATGLESISHIGRSLSIMPEKTTEVDFFLEKTDRNPCFIDNEIQYADYLGNATLPTLQTDNKRDVVAKLKTEFPAISFNETATIESMKRLFERSNELVESCENEQIWFEIMKQEALSWLSIKQTAQ